MSQEIHRRLRPGQTFVDVGANTGWYTMLAASAVAPTGRVVAIEASPTNFSWLERNVDNNRPGNVRLINAAVWSSECTLPLFQGPSSHSGVSTVVPSFAARRGCELTGQIRARTLAELLSADEIASLRVLKIDVEGAEREVLLGLDPVLDSVPDDLELFLELSPTEYDVDEVLRPFRKRGFRVWTIPNPYDAEYYLQFSTHRGQGDLEELVEAPEQQVDVVLSRSGP